MKSFDYQQALERLGGDDELLGEIAGIFTDTAPSLLAQIRGAIPDARHEELTRAAHTLKGSVANFAATNAFEAARELELAARAAQAERYDELAQRLEVHLAELMDELRTLNAEVGG